jgi:hypothetical protein
MKNIFKAGLAMPSTPALREAIIGFIVESLQPYVDEKSLAVSGLHLYIVCHDPAAEEAAQVALYQDKPDRFKTAQLERKLLNHFIQLNEGWFFEWKLVKDEAELPVNCIRKDNLALMVTRQGDRPVSDRVSKALVQILTGQAEQREYILDPALQLKFHIGRTKNPQLFSGRIQQNDIVFLGEDEPGYNELTGSPNLRVSRNHACIVYDSRAGAWMLYPDKGGLPENGNKLKVHTGNDRVKWLHIHGVGHRLCDDDQVELGGAVILRFQLLKS